MQLYDISRNVGKCLWGQNALVIFMKFLSVKCICIFVHLSSSVRHKKVGMVWSEPCSEKQNISVLYIISRKYKISKMVKTDNEMYHLTLKTVRASDLISRNLLCTPHPQLYSYVGTRRALQFMGFSMEKKHSQMKFQLDSSMKKIHFTNGYSC